MNNFSPEGGYTPPQQPAGKKALGPLETVAVIVMVLLIAGPLIGFAVYMANKQSEERSSERAAFTPAIGNLLFAAKEPGSGAARPKLGKVALIDADKRALDELQPYLPDDIHARTPEEVTTVVQMHYMRSVVGKFSSGAHAVQVGARLTVVDVSSRTVIATRSFDWGKPPTSIPAASGSDDVTGSAPMKEISAFLTGLR
jgi:hypothetical protein